MLQAGKVDRIVLSRPAVEAGERLGFLPGDMKEKVDPYLRPLYDALHDMMPAEQVVRRLTNGEIEVAPLAPAARAARPAIASACAIRRRQAGSATITLTSSRIPACAGQLLASGSIAHLPVASSGWLVSRARRASRRLSPAAAAR